MSKGAWIAGGIGATLAVATIAAILILKGFHPSGAITLGDAIVGIGTLALAAFTATLADYTKKLADETRSEIALSRREIEESHRPVVMPVLSDEWFPAIRRGEGLADAPKLELPLLNVGTGPALDVYVEVIGRNRVGGFSEAWGDSAYVGTLVVLAVGQPENILVEMPTNVGDVPGFDLTIRYKDVAGTGWMTTAEFRRSKDGESLYIKPLTGPDPDAPPANQV
ncbi:MAG: hypothetical protein ACLP01_05365 [Solirubrobacteraceae bacterium]